MDLKHKGITWVGNFFQKLEAVCQEVDDIVNKDTVKYVENQLQTMGGSVKKFCSDVVQDVLPPLVDPVKSQAQVVALKSNDAINTYLKAMMGDEENHVDVIKQSHVEPNADDHLKKQLPDTSSELCLVNQNVPPTSVDCLEVEETVSSLQEIDDIMTDENPNVSAEENATEDSMTEVLELFSLNDKEPFGASFSCEFSESNHQNAFGVVAEVPPASSFHFVEFQSPPKMGTVTDCREEVSQSVCDVSSMNTSSESVFSVISDEKTIVEMKLVCSSSSLPVESCSLSGKSPDNSLYAASCNNHGDCICHSYSKLPSSAPAPVILCKENADKLGHDSSSSILLSESIEEDTSSIKEIQESSGNRRIHFWESAQGPSYDLNNDINDSSMETVKLCDEVKLDESCVIVEPSELYAVSRRVRKLRSYRVYQGLDVGSAKPSPSDRKEVPHHLVDILHPSEEYSVGQFFEDARQATRCILDSGRVPIVTGGTGLYLRWFMYGKPDVPKASPEIASEVCSELADLQRNEDWDAAVQLVVKAGDPKAQFLAANDWYRLRRSLEIIKSTGSPPSAFRVPYDSFRDQCDGVMVSSHDVNTSADVLEENNSKDLDYDFICFFLSSRRVDLYKLIDYRCEDMLSGSDGILSEARWLLDTGLLPNSNSATRAIGYRQAMEYLLYCRQQGGRSSPGDFFAFLSDFQKASRNFAKRQLTWFRNEQMYHWLDASKPLEQVMNFIYDAYHENSGALVVPESLRMKKDISNRRETSELKAYRTRNRHFVSRQDCSHILDWIRRTQPTGEATNA